MKSIVISIATIAAALAPANGYAITQTTALNCRSGPGTSFGVVRTYSAGEDIQISCQQAGEQVNNVSTWDKTQDGCFVADFFVETGTSAYVAPKCDAGSPSAPPSTPPSTPPPPPGPGPTNSGPCTGLSDAGIQLIKEFEGFVPSPAPDPIGLPTVGYGHLCKTTGCGEVTQGFPLTPSTAEELLRSDIPIYSKCFAQTLKDSVTLNDNQFAALVSWTFNVGCGAVASSDLVARLNSGEDANAVVKSELVQWNKAGGREMPGLTRRRNAEINLFTTPSSKQAHPNCSS
ncbi:hypothetical protein GGI12_002886 [Dipsacomyces acuminosporus]|nr:hypothetical protein GGI12_002886 [Dipsacomyces acuminosporus]